MKSKNLVIKNYDYISVSTQYQASVFRHVILWDKPSRINCFRTVCWLLRASPSRPSRTLFVVLVALCLFFFVFSSKAYTRHIGDSNHRLKLAAIDHYTLRGTTDIYDRIRENHEASEGDGCKVPPEWKQASQISHNCSQKTRSP